MGAEIYDEWAIHAGMLADHVRNRAYALGLARNVHPGDVVIDVGAGTGILSFLALQAGAARVYAIERAAIARRLQDEVRRRRLQQQVIVVEGDACHVDLPERGDVIVSEWMGTFGIDENFLSPVLIARDRWLAPGGRVVPQRVATWLGVVDSSAVASIPVQWPGVRFAAAGLSRAHLLGAPATLWEIHVAELPAVDAQRPFTSRATIEITAPARSPCVTLWFDAWFDDRILLSNRPGCPPNHWGVFLFPIGHGVRRGESLVIDWTTQPAEPGYCTHAWQVSGKGWAALGSTETSGGSLVHPTAARHAAPPCAGPQAATTATPRA